MSAYKGQVSVTGDLYTRMSAEAKRRKITLSDVVDAALDGQWPDGNPRVQRMMGKPSTHVPQEQRCSLDVSDAVLSLIDDRLTRLREIEGVEMSRAELFDRVVNAVLDAEGCGA